MGSKLFFVVLMCYGLSYGQAPSYLMINSKGDQAVLLLDYKSLKPLGKVLVGEDPHEIVISPEGKTAYISKPQMNANGHEIAVVDIPTRRLEKIIDTRPFFVPHGLVLQKGKLWFTAQGSKAVGVYDIASEKVKTVFGTGQDFTHLIHVTPDGNRFYCTNVESGTVSIYEKKELPPYLPPTGVLPPNAKPRVEWRQTLVEVGVGAEGFDVSPD